MSNVAKSASEKRFQENFVQELKKFKWQTPDELNGNTHKVTVDDLIDHWRSELNRINADQLEGVALTDNEFKQILAKVSQINNSYEAAKILAIEDSKGKIDGIYRDDNLPGVTRRQITLTIFKKAEVSGGDSSYKIAREISTSKGNRFDIVLLINGLPLINIEQKRADKTLNEAFGQFKRYYQDGEYSNNFMAFSQMMVVTSEIETRYFATPKTIDDFNPSFVFHWSDKENKIVNDWRKIVETFLMIPMAHQMVGDYLVIDEAKDEENRRHMLMRPYQVYALQAIELAAFGSDNESKIAHGGFVWHTTGSGKTITSFKTALFLATRAGFDKVIFLVDRRELDSRTSDNFKAYAAYEPVTVDDTQSTYQLKKRLKSSKGIIVTTTFKLNSLVKDLEEQHDDSLKDKNFIFIIDEAHRTTMGQMMGTIKRYFKQNGLFYGFTGTPLFDENNVKGKINEKSEVINTTEKLFGPLLHQYTIDEAIADGNVLGFHVDYINTGEFKNYEDLREQIIEKFVNENPQSSKKAIEREIQALSDLEIEKKASELNLLIYQDKTHIPRVVTEILENWDSQSQAKEFNAILTVAYKERVLAYYQEFKKQIKDRGIKLNVAMTFSFGNENDPQNVSLTDVEQMFKDYAGFTGIEFVAGDKKHGEDAYFEDLIERATRGGSGRNPKNIDLIIVADQLLTGYDSKRLNTLYVDRKLELQKLIQAYSRTNRVFGSSKEFGTIINFQYPRTTEERVDMALKLYGSGGKNSRVIVDMYEVAVNKLKNCMLQLQQVCQDPTAWADIKGNEKAEKEFKKAFMAAASQFNLVEQYYEYKWDDKQFGITEHVWLQYVGAYKNIFDTQIPPVEDEIIRPLVGKTRLTRTQVINASHILGLIDEKIHVVNGLQTIDSETLRLIYEQIQELSDMGEAQQAKLLKEFVDEKLSKNQLAAGLRFDEAFEAWKQDKIQSEIVAFARDWGINEEILAQSVRDYSEAKPHEIPYYDEISESLSYYDAEKKSGKSALEHRMSLSNEIDEWMKNLKKNYQ